MVITHNMKNKKLLLGIAWAWLTCMSANAEVKLPAFFSDGMVMQQQTRANLWGTATPNAPVKQQVGINKPIKLLPMQKARGNLLYPPPLPEALTRSLLMMES